ncbi:MAG: DNA topoisomerase IV subunit A [Planctomycetes bacterium]|nr:DNA topoisomerase IV subunit A [Planctomycetota bacterium]
MAQLEPLMQKNFLEYASYVVLDRAIPDLRDGLKPVQRRILTTLFGMNDGRFHKVANVIGETMKLHPHGDAAIGDALVVLANKDYFIERQGNFGNLFTGHAAAAARYIECRLTPLALDTLFNKAITEFIPSYDGRKEEPVVLPTKLPVLLLLGTEGIAVGMATKILPHNLKELLEAQIAILRKEPFELFPDFAQGGQMDVAEYQDGKGKVTVRARLEARDEKRIVITELPPSTTTESLISSIEAAAQSGKVKISEINDFTTDRVEIELVLQRGAYAKEVIPQLYAYTDCEVSISSSITAIADGRPAELGVSEVLHLLTERLKQILEAELRYELSQLRDKQHWMTLERLFIEKAVYKRIETAKTQEAVDKAVWDGMHEHAKLFARPMVKEDVEHLLKIQIRRISAFDIEKHKKDLEEVLANIAEREQKLADMKKTTIAYLRGLVAKYGASYPRRTQIRKIQAVDKREVANANIKMSYDRESGFFGTKVRGEEFPLHISEFDKVLLISDDGSYRVVGDIEKLLVPGKLLHAQILDPEVGAAFTLVYRDKQRIAWAKKFTIKSFIKEKEYELIKDRAGKVDLLEPGINGGKVLVKFAPSPRQRVHEAYFDLDSVEEKGVSARGNRIAPKAVARVLRPKE